ncbi:hypothetical protein [uncultured Erythrobacter sp.]|uniref:hypothetical protein n=1 Tax=uncultured Erythrobacter sp. TaxID=263913 RepID=UPI002639FCC1|nr:hypothetical protein [uncultured Erythrobacter sp.]
MRRSPITAALLTAFALSACQNTAGAPSVASTPVDASAPAQTAPSPPAFVEAACGGCHSVEPPFLSPNPEVPSFESIANREGLTEATVASWLTDAHNYPEAMDFDLEPEHVEQIADYLIKLRREDYVPQP